MCWKRRRYHREVHFISAVIFLFSVFELIDESRKFSGLSCAPVFVFCSDPFIVLLSFVCRVSRVPTKMSTQAPTFTQPLQSVVALEGSAATFEAQVSGKLVVKTSDFIPECSVKFSPT